MLWLIMFCLVAVCESVNETENWLDVKITQGPVRGRWDPTGELYIFRNIPYAKVPTGKDKFKAPLPPPTWGEPLKPNDKGIICHQNKGFDGFTIEEQCLIANVYVPRTMKRNLSVLVNVHGGGFTVGYGDQCQKKNLLKDKDLIYVNFNYRLGLRGFLCLGTDDVPGNAGLKDVVALLHWVRRNIAAFGGNPNDVTLEGFSAGAVAVDLLMLSKSAEGFFNKVITESGIGLSGSAIQLNPVQNAKDFAKELGFLNYNDIYALEDFYKGLSLDTYASNRTLPLPDSVIFNPCIERNTSIEGLLTDTPFNIVKRGSYKKVPLLYGFCNMEGLMWINDFDTKKNEMNEKLSNFLPIDLKFESEEEKEEVAKQIRAFYFNNETINNNNILSYVDYFTDIVFAYPLLRAVKLHAAAGHDQIYLYEYSFVDEDSPIVPYTDVRGAYHCSQTMAVSDFSSTTVAEDHISQELSIMKKVIRKYWHSFIKTGKFETELLASWKTAGPNLTYMFFGQSVEIREALLVDRLAFWENIYQKHYRQPIPPPQPPARSSMDRFVVTRKVASSNGNSAVNSLQFNNYLYIALVTIIVAHFR